MSAEIAEDEQIVLFDGVCTLCNGFVQFIVPRDPEGQFRFASLQSDVGTELLEKHDLPTDRLESIVLIEGGENGEAYVKSAAVIRIAAHLGGVYRVLSPFRFAPRALRDAAYDFVAKRRYRWFGKKDRCDIPEGVDNVGARFLE